MENSPIERCPLSRHPPAPIPQIDIMLDAGTLSYDQIYLQARTAKGSGKFKLAQGGLGWKESSTGQVTTVPSADFTAISWLHAMRGHELRIYTRDGAIYKFDGFPSEALDELSEFAKVNYHLPVVTKELSIKGWNWGRIDLDGNHLEFKVGDKMAFDLPLTDVANAIVSSKDEIAIEFAQPESVDKKTDTVVEVRLYIPSVGEKKEDDSKEEDDDEDIDAVKSLCEKIKGFSQLNNVAGETIVSIPEMPCIVPRGRFELDMSATHLRLHGKSYDHRILYSSIVKLFLLPKADETHILFILALDPPIRQGQTRYPFLVFQFDKDEEIEIDLQNIDDETLKTKYEGKLQMHYDAPTFEVLSTLFRLLAGQKIIVPGSFRNHMDGSSLKCAFKANEGFLYPLERNFLFLPKPVTLIPHADISHVEFSRMGSGLGNPRSFDLKFYLKSGQDIAFSNITKEEYQLLERFLKQKSIEHRSKDEEGALLKRQSAYGQGDSDDDEEPPKHAKGDVDESSPDEDYECSENESSVDEEYNEDYESEGDDGNSRSSSDEVEEEEEDDDDDDDK